MAGGIGSAIGSSTEHSDVLGDGRLLKQLLRPGSGSLPQLGDVAKVHYTCRLADGEETLDSSHGGPFDFTIGESEVILGLEHAVTSMQKGELAAFTVHPDLALGLAGCGGGMVPPNRPSPPAPSDEAEMDCTSGASTGAGTLRLEVDLLSIGRQDAADLQGLSQEERLQRAMKAKESGNVSFKAGLLEPAADEYELALQSLGFTTATSEGHSPAVEAAGADTETWADAPRREARNKLALSCFLNLAQCELRLERFVAAQEHAGQALALDPENSKAIYRRGVAALNVGLLERAKADLVEAARREPRSAEVRAQLQECQRRLQASEKRDRSTFGGMFGKVSLYDEKSPALPRHDLAALTRVFLRFEGGGLEFLPDGGRVELALFFDTVPKAAENFRLLCTGERGISASSGRMLCYRGSRVHRLAKGSLLQAGDIGPAGDGTGGESAIGGTLKDEFLNEPLNRKGLLGMSNQGPDTIGSQFFLTLAAAPQFEGSFVIVGEVVSGAAVLAALERMEVDDKEQPVQLCQITDCGECAGEGGSVASNAQREPGPADGS